LCLALCFLSPATTEARRHPPLSFKEPTIHLLFFKPPKDLHPLPTAPILAFKGAPFTSIVNSKSLFKH